MGGGGAGVGAEGEDQGGEFCELVVVWVVGLGDELGEVEGDLLVVGFSGTMVERASPYSVEYSRRKALLACIARVSDTGILVTGTRGTRGKSGMVLLRRDVCIIEYTTSR